MTLGAYAWLRPPGRYKDRGKSERLRLEPYIVIMGDILDRPPGAYGAKNMGSSEWRVWFNQPIELVLHGMPSGFTLTSV